MEFIDTSLYDCRRPNPNNGNEFIYDRPLDWSKQVENGAKFAFIKSSESSYEDPGFKVQWNAAKKTNLILGAWHFFHPSEDAISQAQLQISLLKQVDFKWTGDSKTSDKIQLDLEVMDGCDPITVAKAAGSWYYEINKAFPNFEKDIYVGFFFWYTLWNSASSYLSWAKDTKLWMPAYPLDPSPRTINPFPPFNKEQVDALCAGAFTTYAFRDLPPWGQPSYRQITGYADSRFVPGHPGIKKVVDIDALNPNYFNDEPIPTPPPPPTGYINYKCNCGVNIRSKPISAPETFIRVAITGEILKIATPIKRENGYIQLFDNSWVFEQYVTAVNPTPPPPVSSDDAYFVVPNAINLRKEPNSNSDIVRVIYKSNEPIVHILIETLSSFGYVELSDKTGWVSFQYLKK